MRKKFCVLLDIDATKTKKPKPTNQQAGGIEKYVLQRKTS